jgi:hypothetical protein
MEGINMYNKSLMESMREALAMAGLREVPEKDDGEHIYTRAIALVKKRDGSINYALLKKNIEGKDVVCADFGHVCTMSAILEVYPYEYLDEMYMPMRNMTEKTTASQKRAAIFELKEGGELTSEYTKERIQKMKVGEMNGLLIGVGAKRQWDAEKRRLEAKMHVEATREKMSEEDKKIEEARVNLMQGIIPQEILEANENKNNDKEEENGQGEE